MSRIVITVDVPENPSLVDPEEVGEFITDIYNEWALHSPHGTTPIEFVSAEWVP